MDETDDFPFADIEDFEKAVLMCMEDQSSQKERFAYAPPISLCYGIMPVNMESPRFHNEEEKRKSPQARTQSSHKDIMEQFTRLEAHMEEKWEQLQSLYFHLADRIKLLEKRIK